MTPTPFTPVHNSWRKWLFNTLIGLLVIAFLVWWQWYYNPLPSDKEMLAHFNTHRSGLEQLVQGYRNFRPARTWPGMTSYEHQEEVKELMKELGINHVIEAQGASGRWYPTPYSERTLQILKALYVRPIDNLADENEVMKTLREQMPVLFNSAQVPLRDILDVARTTTVIHAQLGSLKHRYSKHRLRYFATDIHKGYYYFPQIPRVESGRILKSSQFGYSLGQRVFDSLDDYPPNWKRGECVLKRIDPHWFIAMCRTA
jgi:hypothetical protein